MITRTEQSTKCFVTLQKLGVRLCTYIVKLVLAFPTNAILTVFQGGDSVVVLCCLLHCILCQSFGDISPYVCSYDFSSISIAEWPPFGI